MMFSGSGLYAARIIAEQRIVEVDVMVQRRAIVPWCLRAGRSAAIIASLVFP
jgi:hypothetical protein